MALALRFCCPQCHRRAPWCRTCKVRHCHVCSPHPSRARKYLGKNHMIQRRSGGCLMIMSARRYAHLRGASKGGQTTAGRPNPGRFTPETARLAAQKAWSTRWRLSRGGNGRATPLRIGRVRKYRPAVDRAAVRAQYAYTLKSTGDLDRQALSGLTYFPPAGLRTKGVWSLATTVYPNGDGNMAVTSERVISERAALRRLGLLPTYTKNWVPTDEDRIVKTTVLGRASAWKLSRRKKTT